MLIRLPKFKDKTTSVDGRVLSELDIGCRFSSEYIRGCLAFVFVCVRGLFIGCKTCGPTGEADRRPVGVAVALRRSHYAVNHINMRVVCLLCTPGKAGISSSVVDVLRCVNDCC